MKPGEIVFFITLVLLGSGVWVIHMRRLRRKVADRGKPAPAWSRLVVAGVIAFTGTLVLLVLTGLNPLLLDLALAAIVVFWLAIAFARRDE